MTSISFPCRQCSQKYRVAGEMAGRRLKCKKCGEVLTVPTPRRPSAVATATAPAVTAAAQRTEAPSRPPLREFNEGAGRVSPPEAPPRDRAPRVAPSPPPPPPPPQVDLYGLDDDVEAALPSPLADLYDLEDDPAGTGEPLDPDEASHDDDEDAPRTLLPRRRSAPKARTSDAERAMPFWGYGRRLLAKVGFGLGAVMLVVLAVTMPRISGPTRLGLFAMTIPTMIVGRIATKDRSPEAVKARERAKREKARKKAERRAASGGWHIGHMLLYLGVGGFLLPMVGLQFKVLIPLGALAPAVAAVLAVVGLLITLGSSRD